MSDVRPCIAAQQFGALERFLCDGDEGPEYFEALLLHESPTSAAFYCCCG